MRLPSLRLYSVLVLLISMSFIISLPALAKPSEMHSGQTFQPDGHGFATAQKVSVATVPQVQGPVSGIAFPPRKSPGPSTIPLTQSITDVPLPTQTDPSAFAGISDDGVSKPDGSGAGGTVNYLEAVNSELAIYSRGGAQEYMTTFQQWFGINTPYHDPKVIWDAAGQRFIFSVNVGFELILSVAQQADATGTFCNYTLPTPSQFNGGVGADFDMLGVNGGGIYISANILNPNNGNQISNELFATNRVQMESCVKNVPYSTWTGLTNPDGSLVEALVPSVMENGPAGTEYLVNSLQFGGCQLTLWTLVVASSQLSNTTVPTQCYSPPPNAKQLGSNYLIGAGTDNSLTQASYLGNLLTVAMPSAYNWNNGQGPVSIVEWFVLNVSGASVFKQGAFGTPGYWLFFPAAVRAANGHMLFIYNISGSRIYPSLAYVNQIPSDTVFLAQGNSYYAPPGGSPWGSYNSVWLDMSGSNPNAGWITGEYAQATNSWGTEFGLVTP